MSQASRAIPVFLLVAALAACASTARRSEDTPDPLGRDTRVAVQNNSPDNMEIYVENAVGGRWRLGTVMSSSRSSLVIPPDMLSVWGVRLVAHPIGTRSSSVFPCDVVRRGSTIVLDLEHTFDQSNCWRR